VTVRALHHYERLRLLRPRRTPSGYRLYAPGDLERLEQVIALKALGLPLKRIAVLLNRDMLQLPDALRMQRAVLEDKRRLLDRAISAIQEALATIQPGNPADPVVMKKIIAAFKIQDSPDFLKQYFSDEAWAKWKQLRQQTTPDSTQRISQAWAELWKDIEASFEEEPASEKAQDLARRWMKLVQIASAGDLDIQTGWRDAWANRERWPEELKQHTASVNIERIVDFIGKAVACGVKRYYDTEG
jgi:DNA-binding transcriptional MerR regulator